MFWAKKNHEKNIEWVLQYGSAGMIAGKIGLSLENEEILDRNRNLALQQVIYEPLKELLELV